MKWKKFWLQHAVLATTGTLAIGFGTGLLPPPQPLGLIHGTPSQPSPAHAESYKPPQTPEPRPEKAPSLPVIPEQNSYKPSPTIKAPPSPAAEVAEMERWAMVRKANPGVFTPHRRTLPPIPLATIVEFTDTRTTDEGEQAVCHVHFEHGVQTNIHIFTKDLEIVNRPLSTATRREIDLHGIRLHLKQAIDKESSRIADAEPRMPGTGTEKTNPYEAEYRRKKSEYDRFRSEAERLTAKRDTATGSERTELIKKLTTMKNDGMRIVPPFEEIQKKYLQWNRSNRTKRATSRPSDTHLKGLQKRLAEINKKISEIETAM